MHNLKGSSLIEIDAMIEKTENRKKPRFTHISSLQVKDLKTGQIYEARMFNYSDSGIYFESNVDFKKGTKIYISIQNSPFSCSSGVLKYYKGEVRWRKYLKRSYFNYGYGIQLLSDSNNSRTESSSAKTTKELRKHSRKPFFRSIEFSNDKGAFSGTTKNISPSGVFIATEEKLEIGKILKLSFPHKGQIINVIGQVVWINDEGFGLKFKRMG
jgi:Tfp pilus assembly protein PilZ